MLLRSQFPDLVLEDALPVLEKVIFEGYKMADDILPELFNQYSMDQAITQSTGIGGLPIAPVNSEGAALSYDDVDQLYDKTYTALKYRLGVKITEEMIEDNKFITTVKLAEELGKAMKEAKLVAGHAIFNNGFATDTGPDGVYLFSASHPLPSVGGTDSNVGTADLSVASLRSGIEAMRETLNARGLKRPLKARKLVVPVANQWLAAELIKSYQKPYTADNEVNTFPNLDIVVGDYLTLGSGTWFLLADKGDHDLNQFQRVSMSVKSDDDFDADSRKIACRERFVFGYNDWRGTFGSPGA